MGLYPETSKLEPLPTRSGRPNQSTNLVSGADLLMGTPGRLTDFVKTLVEPERISALRADNSCYTGISLWFDGDNFYADNLMFKNVTPEPGLLNAVAPHYGPIYCVPGLQEAHHRGHWISWLQLALGFPHDSLMAEVRRFTVTLSFFIGGRLPKQRRLKDSDHHLRHPASKGRRSGTRTPTPTFSWAFPHTSVVCNGGSAALR